MNNKLKIATVLAVPAFVGVGITFLVLALICGGGAWLLLFQVLYVEGSLIGLAFVAAVALVTWSQVSEVLKGEADWGDTAVAVFSTITCFAVAAVVLGAIYSMFVALFL